MASQHKRYCQRLGSYIAQTSLVVDFCYNKAIALSHPLGNLGPATYVLHLYILSESAWWTSYVS